MMALYKHYLIDLWSPWIRDKKTVLTQCYGVEVVRNIVFYSLPRARARFVANIPIF